MEPDGFLERRQHSVATVGLVRALRTNGFAAEFQEWSDYWEVWVSKDGLRQDGGCWKRIGQHETELAKWKALDHCYKTLKRRLVLADQRCEGR